ncbi:MAG TPA: hypothetical protein VIL01_15355 [Thermomicrobiales bacterium]|jgi:hypothetical protein
MTESTPCGAGNDCCRGASSVAGKDCAYRSSEEAVELLRADAGDVQATTVTLERSGAERIEAERLTMDRSGAREIAAKSAQLDRSGVMVLKSDRAVLHGTSAVAVGAQEARIVRSMAGVVVSGNTTVEGELRTLVHVGPTEGNVRTLIDPVGAAGFGAAFGLAVVMGGRLLRRFVSGR